ncbi:MAG: hypothetical protein QOF09_2074 [Alphaproteobacteria bacterium]|jgi:hypothetical protein|nr:hypothetical protein [Alphaproteobacteria bacterium]
MSIVSQDHFAVSRSFPGGYVSTSGLNPGLVAAALVSLLGLSVSALVLASGLSADLEAIAFLLG